MSASVTVDTNKIDRVLGELLALSVAEVGRTLVDIADDAEANAAGKWYTQVRKRTGKTGKLKTELRRGTGDKLEAVVSSATETDKRTYLVHRPGPLSMRKKKVLASEYAEIMSYFRKNGRLPEGIVARRIDETGQPVQLSREVRNPLASDGKNLWNELARKEGTKIILARADDLDAAMQRAADRLRQG
jgi:hypothetical protein